LHTSSSAAIKAAATTLKIFTINYQFQLMVLYIDSRLTWSCAR